MQFEPSTSSIGAVPAKKSSKFVNFGQKFKFGCRQGYGNFDSMMQKSSARRTMQHEWSTSPTDTVLAKIRQILSPIGPQSNLDISKSPPMVPQRKIRNNWKLSR
ncbi:MAG: hypothetical protein GY820_30730 [Gammaproteobacteria bacterium]|nr:hypothetical protein [Gammaproteobacteria bacterium]